MKQVCISAVGPREVEFQEFSLGESPFDASDVLIESEYSLTDPETTPSVSNKDMT